MIEWNYVNSIDDIPAPGENVLIALKDGTFDVGYADNTVESFFDQYGEDEYDISLVVAWAELPPHPMYEEE